MYAVLTPINVSFCHIFLRKTPVRGYPDENEKGKEEEKLVPSMATEMEDEGNEKIYFWDINCLIHTVTEYEEAANRYLLEILLDQRSRDRQEVWELLHLKNRGIMNTSWENEIKKTNLT